MVRLRVLLACLLMAALPLQGLAAVSMMLCGGPAAVSSGGHSHGHGDEASHQHGSSSDQAAADHATHVHGASHDTAGTDATHECGICGAGCHSVAIATSVEPVHVSAMPQAPVASPLPAVYTRTTPVPDRPPRA